MGAWDGAPEPEGPAVNFVTLKEAGDEFVGRVETVELVTLKAEDLPKSWNQKTDLVDVPQLTYTGVDGQTYEFTYTTAVFRNAILRLKPEPGTWVYHKRLAKNPKGYIDGIVRVARAEETVPGGNASYSVSAESVGAKPETPVSSAGLSSPAGPVGDDAPPF